MKKTTEPIKYWLIIAIAIALSSSYTGAYSGINWLFNTGTVGVTNEGIGNTTNFLYFNANGSGGGGGTVTSVGLARTGTTAVSVSGSPVTTAGTLSLAFQNATASQDGLLRSVDFSTFNSKAGTGNCASGQVVMNTTTTGVQCVGLGGANSTVYVNTDNYINITGNVINANLTTFDLRYVLKSVYDAFTAAIYTNVTATQAAIVVLQSFDSAVYVNVTNLQVSDSAQTLRLDSLNLTKLNASDQRYNDSASINALSVFAQTKAGTGTATCTTGQVVMNVTITNSTVTTQCVTDATGSTGGSGNITGSNGVNGFIAKFTNSTNIATALLSDNGTRTTLSNTSLIGAKTYNYNLFNIGSGNTNQSIDLKESLLFNITLTGPITVGFTAPLGPQRFSLIITQDATGSRVITWNTTNTIKWAGAAAPTLTTTASRSDIVTCLYDGLNATGVYYCSATLNFG